MQNSSTDDARNVVPRWRSHFALAPWEIAAGRDVKNTPISATDFSDQLMIWRAERSIASSVDIYETGIITGDDSLIFEGIGPILSSSTLVPERLLDSIRHTLADAPDLLKIRDRLAKLEQNENYLRSTIRMLKKKIRDFPRDVFSNLEIARNYVLLGQTGRAEPFLRRALHLAPNSRYVIRSAVQFYCIVGGIDEALPIIWRSDSSKYDPLIQSAEIAAADLGHKGSRFAASAIRSLKGVKSVGIAQSELALAAATIEYNAGVPQRKVLRLARTGLPNGTENAQAQAIWLGEQSDRGIQSILSAVNFTYDAYEARTLALVENEQYEKAVIQAHLWLNDQPFQIDPVNFICNIYAVNLNRPRDAVDIAMRACAIHPDNWSIQNAAFLVFAGAGLLDKAAECLVNLAKHTHNAPVKAFVAADAGMLAFARMQIEEGRKQYQDAIIEARRIRRSDLIFSALAFWILAEAKTSSLPLADVDRLDNDMASSIKKLLPDQRDYARKLWKSVLLQIRKLAVPDDPQGILPFYPTLSAALETLSIE